MVVHFLHIGKTGGTAVKHALMQAMDSSTHRIELHDHSTRLADVPAGELVIFFVRNPLSRFVSGFYSRQRQGAPRYQSPWSDQERTAFERFRTPNECAAALSAADEEQRRFASAAMHSIAHVRSSYWDWFQDEEYFLSRVADVFFIGFQEQLPMDFERLRHKLGLPQPLSLPEDDVHAHRNPAELDRNLTDVAVANLTRWYARDFAFVEMCRTVARELHHPTPDMVLS